MISTKVGRRGQITLPKRIRLELHLEEGDRLAFVRKGGDVVLQPLRAGLKDFRGTIDVGGPQDFDQIRKEVRHKRASARAADGD